MVNFVAPLAQHVKRDGYSQALCELLQAGPYLFKRAPPVPYPAPIHYVRLKIVVYSFLMWRLQMTNRRKIIMTVGLP